MSNVIVGGNLIAAITGGVFHTTPLARAVDGTSKLQASPASIMAYYIIEELEEMTDPSDADVWPLFTSHLPDLDNIKTNCGAIYDTTGVNDLRSMNGGVPQHPGIQIRIRSDDYETGYVKIEDIGNALDEVINQSFTIGDLEYELQNVSRTSPIVSLGMEEGTKRRFHFTINFLLTIRELTG